MFLYFNCALTGLTGFLIVSKYFGLYTGLLLNLFLHYIENFWRFFLFNSNYIALVSKKPFAYPFIFESITHSGLIFIIVLVTNNLFNTSLHRETFLDIIISSKFAWFISIECLEY